MKRLLALLILAGLASTAAAHGGVTIRRTPLNPFRGPVAHVHYGAGFSAGFNAPIYYGSQNFRFRYGYSAPIFYGSQSFYAPQPFYLPAPQPIVVQAPQPIVYAAPQPVVYSQPVTYSQGYSYSSGTQAIRVENEYILSDGRTVLPDGRIVPAP